MSLKIKVSEIRKEIGVMQRTKENPFYKSLYFDINDLVEHLDPILEKHNVMILQPLTVIEGRTAVKTIVHDLESDEVLETLALIPEGLDSQKMGGAITFLRRYSIKSLFFLREEDDDANKAVGNKTVPAQTGSELPFESKPKKTVGQPCPDCGTPYVAGARGAYCKPCYIKWAEANKK